MRKNTEYFVSKAYEKQQNLFSSLKLSNQMKKYLRDLLILIRFFANSYW